MKRIEGIAPDLSKRILILNGSFAGVALAQRLERLLPEQTEIIVHGVDDQTNDC